MLGGYVVGIVREEFGEVVCVDLFGDGVCLDEVNSGIEQREGNSTYWSDEDVFEETFLTGGDVGEPAVRYSIS